MMPKLEVHRCSSLMQLFPEATVSHHFTLDNMCTVLHEKIQMCSWLISRLTTSALEK